MSANLFKGDAWNDFHDILLTALDVDLNKSQSIGVFQYLPDDLKEIGFNRGLDSELFLETSFDVLENNAAFYTSVLPNNSKHVI
ncbi:MAG: hypothetical protein QM504_10155 [Pseudomonadota bacterium]